MNANSHMDTDGVLKGSTNAQYRLVYWNCMLHWKVHEVVSEFETSTLEILDCGKEVEQGKTYETENYQPILLIVNDY